MYTLEAINNNENTNDRTPVDLFSKEIQNINLHTNVSHMLSIA